MRHNSNKILQASIMSTRCAICEAGRKVRETIREHVCVKNYSGSSGGMKPEAALQMIMEIQEETKGAIYRKTYVQMMLRHCVLL